MDTHIWRGITVEEITAGRRDTNKQSKLLEKSERESEIYTLAASKTNMEADALCVFSHFELLSIWQIMTTLGGPAYGILWKHTVCVLYRQAWLPPISS